MSLVFVVCVSMLLAQAKIAIRANGASFPDRLYFDAAYAYTFVKPQVEVLYVSTGSGKGKCRIMNFTEQCDVKTDGAHIAPLVIDWAGSDSLLRYPSNYEAYPDLQMYPAVAGAVVPIYNLEGRREGDPELLLTPRILAKIFGSDLVEGGILYWDDPSIVALNPALNASGVLTHTYIQVVVREESSGTTEIFTKALSEFDESFASRVGITSGASRWSPRVTKAGQNSGVAAVVLSTPNSISYSVLAEANVLKLSKTEMLVGSGTSASTVAATSETVEFAMAEKGAVFGNNGEPVWTLTADIHATNGPKAWPIAGYTYLVMRKDTTHFSHGQSCASRLETVKFWTWFWTSPVAAELAVQHGFAPLPPVVKSIVLGSFLEDVRCNGRVVFKELVPVQPVVYGMGSSLLSSLFSLFTPAYSAATNEATLVWSAACCDGSQGSVNIAAALEGVLSSTLLVGNPLSASQGFALVGASSITVEQAAENVLLPFAGIAFAAIFSPCGIHDSGCSYLDVQLRLSLPLLADILDGTISSWNDTALLPLNEWLAGTPLATAATQIRLIGQPAESETMQILLNLMRRYKPAISFASTFGASGSAIVEGSIERVRSLALATPQSIAITPLIGSIQPLLNLVPLVVASGDEITPSAASLLECASDTFSPSAAGFDGRVILHSSNAPGCYPLAEAMVIMMRRHYSVDECMPQNVSKSLPVIVSEFARWLTSKPNRPPITTNGMAPLSGIHAQFDTLQLNSLLCADAAILAPSPSPPPSHPPTALICPPGFIINVDTGSATCEPCEAGTYEHLGACLACPPGAECDQNSTLSTLRLKLGFWRLSQYTDKTYRCPLKGNVSACLGGSDHLSICRPHHEGPLCLVCVRDGQYFDTDAAACTDCPEASGNVAVFVVLLCTALLVLGWFYFLLNTTNKRWQPLARSVRRTLHHTKKNVLSSGLVTKMKVSLTFMQIVAALDNTYTIGMPESWFRWTAVLRVFGSIDWSGWIVPSSCLIGSDVSRRLLVRSLAPLILICIVPVLCAATACFKRTLRPSKPHIDVLKATSNFASVKASRDGFICGLPASLVLAFCFTPSVSAVIFRAWYCVSFAFDKFEEHRFLADDLSVQCDGSSAHNSILLIAWVMVAIWPIGMVVMYAALLFPCRHMLLNEAPESPLLTATSFLHRDYKPAYYWWEVVSLIQRTTLTGWLLLIDFDLQFIRILSALIVTIAFSVALLVCQPYKRQLDFAMASGAQLLLVCIFIGGIVIRLYEDIANDSAGSKELAFRFLGIRSSEEIVTIMILVALLMLVLLGLTVVGEEYMRFNQRRLETKFSVCTMDPPYVKWPLQRVYAAFISHFKMEAATEARYMHDMLRKMLRAPVFLDSSSLADLRNLITEGVHQSDIVVLLATPGVLSRPWCLLELLEAVRMQIPVVIVHMSNSGFCMDAAKQFVSDLEEEMTRMNPAGLQFLHERLGSDLSELRQACLQVLSQNTGEPIIFDSHESDFTVVAMLKDVVELMCNTKGHSIQWRGTETSDSHSSCFMTRKVSVLPKTRISAGFRSSRPQISRSSSRNELDTTVCIVCNKGSLGHARVLRSGLEIRLARSCSVVCGVGGSNSVMKSSLLVVLLVKEIVMDIHSLYYIWRALEEKLPIAAVTLTGGGYDYEEASRTFNDLPTALSTDAVYELQQLLPGQVSVAQVGKQLHASLTAIVAIAWSPNGTANQMAAVLEGITERVPSELKGALTRRAKYDLSGRRGSKLRAILNDAKKNNFSENEKSGSMNVLLDSARRDSRQLIDSMKKPTAHLTISQTNRLPETLVSQQNRLPAESLLVTGPVQILESLDEDGHLLMLV